MRKPAISPAPDSDAPRAKTRSRAGPAFIVLGVMLMAWGLVADHVGGASAELEGIFHVALFQTGLWSVVLGLILWIRPYLE